MTKARHPDTYRGVRRNAARVNDHLGFDWRAAGLKQRVYKVMRWVMEPNPVITVPPGPLVEVFKQVQRITAVHPSYVEALDRCRRL